MANNSMLRNLKRFIFLVLFLSGCTLFSWGQNPIVSENALPGTPQSVWDANDEGTIEGFAQEFSVNKGETVHFKIEIQNASLVPYTVKIYRLGYYNGNGARFITDLGAGLTGKLQQPYNYETATGKVDCSNWTVSAQWTVPATAVSGVYIARLDCPVVNGKTTLVFVVRDDAANAPMLFKTADATWQAYNNYGGNTFYTAATPVPGYSHATKVSYQRPMALRGDKSGFFNAEYPMLRWLEKNGYHVSYTTDMDMARDASVITPANHKVLLSVGHDEYWSAEMRNKFETARDNGVHLAFFSGNEVYWKTRWENNFQTLVCYKEGTMGESTCGNKCDPLPNVWTGLWRDGCAPGYAANDGCKSEGTLTGQVSWTQSTGSIKVPHTYKNLRFWKNTSIASLSAGQTAVLPYGTLGNEWDPEQFVQAYANHRIILSNTSQGGFTHKMSLYRHNSGALVFGAGTMQWSWGLDNVHDINQATPPNLPPSSDMQQATVNLFYDMGVTAANLQTNLVAPTIGPDALAPSSIIVSPLHLSTIPGGTVTITGTSVDNGTGAVGGVEVSYDNGVTWNLAVGLEDWSYTFTPSGYGAIIIKVRAWDDLGNLEIPGTLGTANCISITPTGPFQYTVFNATHPSTPPDFFTGAPVELGMKFKATVAGNITGFRYYKAPGITGVHTGHLWSSTGTLLATQGFTNETASGWQSVNLATPVAIDANTTYVVSYLTASGDFTKKDPFFTQPVINGFLRGLANGEDGGNGVYAYSNTASFPNNTSGTSNYYADVIYETSDIAPPEVIAVTPSAGSTGHMLNIIPTATFNEILNPTTVTRSTVLLTGPGNVPVGGVITLLQGSVIVFTPNAPLAVNSTYTLTLKGGTAGLVIKDLIGISLAANYSWTFTTGNLAAPQVIGKLDPVSVCANTSVSFSSSAIGIPTPTVQWQKSINNGNSWISISGQNAGTYTFTAVFADNNNLYRALWSNSQGAASTIPALLTVAEDISGTITAQPSSVCTGGPLMLQYNAVSGQSPFTLQINASTYTGIVNALPFRALLGNETLWPASAIPNIANQPDNNSVELGVKFQTNKPGLIKGIRFYKGSNANGGTHSGSLWSQSGTLLASAIFTSETASGWQEVLFATPIEVSANTTYVASYYAPQGNYSKNGTYFSSAYTNGNSLTALQNTVSAPNAVYVYSGQSAFPDQNYEDPNYWVDVLFSAYATNTTTFNLTSITAANGCSVTGNPISTASISIDQPVNAGIISGNSQLCINASTAFTANGHTGGTWASSNPAVAVVSNTGMVTAQSAGETEISYTVVSACGNSTAVKTLTVNRNANAGTVSGNASLCIGASALYSSNGDAEGTWSSSNIAVATVNALGNVMAISAGNTNIIYTVTKGCNSPVSSFKILTVLPNANAGTVFTGNTSLCINVSETFTTNGNPGGVWSSSNTAVAQISSNGTLSTLSAGTTQVIYTLNTGCNSPVSASVLVTVSSNVQAGVVSGPSTLCMGANGTFTSNGIAGGVWSSSNTTVASVSNNGTVAALTAGTTNIIYTISGGCGGPVSAFKVLTVSANVTAGTISGAATLCPGVSSLFNSNGTAGGVWSSSNTTVASVNNNGTVTAISAGTTNIIYTVTGGCGGTAAAFKVLTVGANVTAGTISGAASLCPGVSSLFSSNGTTGGVWSSSNTTVATISSTGMVTAKLTGTTNIIYTVTGCGGQVSTSRLLTVSTNVTAGTISGASTLCIGSTSLFSSNGTGGGVWSSSNSAIASVSTTGVVTARTAGTVNIIYTVNSGCTGSVSAFKSLLIGGTANNITVTGTSPLCIGAKVNYTTNGPSGGTWNSSNTAVATVNSTGQVIALKAGTTIIKYTSNGICGGTVNSTKTLVVNPDANAGEVSGNSPTCFLQTSLFTSNGDPDGTWSSSNPWVGFAWPSGYVTALLFGTADIIYTVNTGCNSPVSAVKTITVSLFADPGTIIGANTVCRGSSTVFTSSGAAGGEWSSSNTSVARVNEYGVVTGNSAGTAIIRYTVGSCTGDGTASKTITVNNITVANAGTVSGSSSLCINASSIYTSSGNTGGAWSSSNTAIATVNATTGLVKALKAGSAIITYTVTPICGTVAKSNKTLTVYACNTFTRSSNGENAESMHSGDQNIPVNKIASGTIYNEVSVEAYPNPTSTFFTVVLEAQGNEKTTVRVTDLLGKQVYMKQGMGKQQFQFGSELKSGMYLLQVIKENSSKTVKLIKD